MLKERRERAKSEWIFENPLYPNKPISPSSAYKHLKIILKNAGLPDIRFHDLRHTTDMQKRASDIVENFVEDIFGKDLNLI